MSDMIYKPSEIIDLQVDELTNILQQRFSNIQIYLEGDFLREMIYLCLSGSILETIARNALYSNIALQPIITKLDPQGMYVLSMSVMTVTSIIIGLLGARYQSKLVEGERIRASIDNIMNGNFRKQDKAAIRRSYNVIKRSGDNISLDKETVDLLIDYLSTCRRRDVEI